MGYGNLPEINKGDKAGEIVGASISGAVLIAALYYMITWLQEKRARDRKRDDMEMNKSLLIEIS
jgi:hypothetical protein